MNNWMKNIPDDFVLSEINVPGTHDSCTARVDFSYLSRCQSLCVTEQLEIGVRFLDIRVKADGDRLLLVHGMAKCYNPRNKKELLYLEDVIAEWEAFLRKNPSETIIFSIKRDAGASAEETFHILYENYLCRGVWYLENRIPTLGEVRGKIVLFNRMCVDNENEDFNDYNTCLNFSGWPDQSKPTRFPCAVSVMVRRDGRPSERFFYQDMYRLKRKEKWKKAVLPMLSSPMQDFGIVLNFLSASDVVHSPRAYARYMNKRFLKENLYSFTKYGWVIFDFPTEKECKKVVLTNF